MAIKPDVKSPKLKGRSLRIKDNTDDKIATYTKFLFLSVGITKATKLKGTAYSKDKELGAKFPKIKPAKTDNCQAKIIGTADPK